jgi:hypothetical protein
MKDISQIRCFKCNQMDHYASKCVNNIDRSTALSEISNVDESQINLAKVKVTFVSSDNPISAFNFLASKHHD